MTKLVAILSLLASSTALTLYNYWYTYGIWPRSWGAFFLFFALGGINFALITAVTKDN